ncbi:DDB1- and CUL4-associated factor 17-like isoform X2 [Ischnura elegans]|uniref:DDB1- and CUL4-associated factor 17-like isoform X2 n=1 Tax=Ischnura elegans TaxID=197161 RepID=UPI001ED8B2FB|nr:DDB1- and CUL4-associated factor 17-like isoform X2 [Ischnura elegans]
MKVFIVLLSNRLYAWLKCFHAYDWRADTKSAYSVPLSECNDIEVWQESTHQVYVKEGHRASMFMLQKAGILLRRDLRTGIILEEIYLPPRYKFMEIIEDREVGHLYLKSKIYSKLPHEDVLSAIIIFSFPHLEFSAFLEVRKSVFGKTALKTEICQGTLLVLHSNKSIKLYSLKEILSKFLQHQYKLGETFTENNVTSVVGKHPLGLPLNVMIVDAPPVLFDVKSAGHSLQVGGHPWHYIICPTVGRYQVFSLSKKIAVEGVIEESNEVEPDVVVFHPDESLKIVHATSSKIVIYKIIQGLYPRLEVFFSLDAFEQRSRKDTQRPKRSSFGRKLSQSNYLNDVMSLMLFDYEDELDIFAILRVKQPVLFQGPQLEIIYTDSSSGKILASRHLPDCSWPMVYDCQYSFEIDGPLLIVKTKKYENMKSTMYVFLLTGEDNT